MRFVVDVVVGVVVVVVVVVVVWVHGRVVWGVQMVEMVVGGAYHGDACSFYGSCVGKDFLGDF